MLLGKFGRQVSLAAFLSVLASCGAVGSIKDKVLGPKTIQLSVSSDALLLNPNYLGKSRETPLVVYEIKDARKFLELPLGTLVKDKQELGSDYVTHTTVTAEPGRSVKQELKLQKETKYVGLLGGFQKPDPDFARYAFLVKDIDRAGVEVFLQDCYMLLKRGKSFAVNTAPAPTKPRCQFVKLNINVANKPELVARASLADDEAERLIAARAMKQFADCRDLTRRRVITQERLNLVKDLIDCTRV